MSGPRLVIELTDKFKPFFYIASICLGVEIAFLIAFLVTPREGWVLYVAMLALACSIPLLAASCIASIVGFMKPLRDLLAAGLILFLVWLALLFLSVSIVAAVLFSLLSLVSYKMLQYHYRDSKATPT